MSAVSSKALVAEQTRSTQRPERLGIVEKWRCIVEEHRHARTLFELNECDEWLSEPKEPHARCNRTGICFAYNDEVLGKIRTSLWLMSVDEMDIRDPDNKSKSVEELPSHLRLAHLAMRQLKHQSRISEGTKLLGCIGLATEYNEETGKHQFKANSCSNVLSNPGERTLTKMQVDQLCDVLSGKGLELEFHPELEVPLCFNDIKERLVRAKPAREDLSQFQWRPADMEYVDKGGFAKAYRYRTASAESIVVKVIELGEDVKQPNGFRRDFGEYMQQNLYRELVFSSANMWGEVQHQGIVEQFGAIAGHRHDIDCIFIFMELCDRPLNTGSTKGNVDKCREYAYQLTNTLQFLHQKRIAHRDLKPKNVFECSTRRGVILKIGDFGCAKGEVDNTRGATTSTGTWPYQAPEVKEGRRAGTKVDVWGLGCIVVEMWNGVWPWSTLSQTQLNRVVCTEGVLPLSSISEHPKIHAFVNQCFIRDPHRRASCSDLLGCDWMQDFARTRIIKAMLLRYSAQRKVFELFDMKVKAEKEARANAEAHAKLAAEDETKTIARQETQAMALQEMIAMTEKSLRIELIEESRTEAAEKAHARAKQEALEATIKAEEEVCEIAPQTATMGAHMAYCQGLPSILRRKCNKPYCFFIVPSATIEWLCSPTIAGGYRIGDRVASQIAFQAGQATISPGDIGTVKGPCSNNSLPDAQIRVLCEFADGGAVNIYFADIYKEGTVIAGGYKAGDRVVSNGAYWASKGKVSPGDSGTVRGPCNDVKLPDAQIRVLCSFPKSGDINMLLAHIHKERSQIAGNFNVGDPVIVTEDVGDKVLKGDIGIVRGPGNNPLTHVLCNFPRRKNANDDVPVKQLRDGGEGGQKS